MQKNLDKSNRTNVPKNIQNDFIIRIFKELSIIKNHHRMLILVTHGFLELMVNVLISRHLKESKKILKDNRTYSHAVKTLMLYERGIIKLADYKVFDWFRKLRNDAAHSAIFELPENHFRKVKYDDLTKSDNFYRLCVDIIGGFWNQHVDDFLPEFAPSIMENSSN